MSIEQISNAQETPYQRPLSPCPFCGIEASSDFYQVVSDVGEFRLEYCTACRRVINADSNII